MKTRKSIRPLAFAMVTLFLVPLQAQVTQLGNFPGTLLPPDYVGWNGSTTIPLEVRHNGNQPIEFWTDSIQRVELNPTESYVVNSSFGAKTANGWMLLSPDIANFLSGANGPYSLLHLAAATNNAQTSSDRPWMNVGMTLTGNSDHSYVGQKARAADKTDMVIHWSDNPATWYGPDRLRFLFTSGYSSSSASGAYSEEGLEGMRLYPVTPDEVNVGLGDW